MQRLIVCTINPNHPSVNHICYPLTTCPQAKGSKRGFQTFPATQLDRVKMPMFFITETDLIFALPLTTAEHNAGLRATEGSINRIKFSGTSTIPSTAAPHYA